MVLDELLSWTIFEEGCCHALNIVLDELLPCTIFEEEVTFTRSHVTNAFITIHCTSQWPARVLPQHSEVENRSLVHNYET